MKYFARLFHLPVIETHTGRKIGFLSDVYVDKNTGSILGIVVRNENILYPNRLILAANIVEEAPAKIFVSGFGKRYAVLPPPLLGDPISYKRQVYNKRAVKPSGENLGKIKDCCFDFEAGKMCELELGKGLSDDFMNGRSRLGLSNGVSLRAAKIEVSENDRVLYRGRGMKKIMKGR